MGSQASARIAARLGDKVLKNVDKYFSGKPYAVAVEILQNARRAGATRVEIETSESGTVVIRDNGRGLSREDAPVLLTFGGSANGADVEFREDPAGMGFFALAGRRVSVTSRDWQLTIAPDTFTGGTDALLTDAKGAVDGLAIEVDSFADARTDAQEAFRQAGAPMPMTVVVDGETIAHTPFSDLIAGKGAATLTRNAHGCEITVCRWQSIADAPSVRQNRYGAQHDLELAVDMFGQVFRVSNASPETFKQYFPGFLSGSVENALTLPPKDPSWPYQDKLNPFWRIAVKIGETSVLAPRLPERDGIVINEGWRTISAEIVDMLVALARSLPANAIPDVSPIRIAAKEAGLEIPPARISIKTASYQTNYGSWGQEPVLRQVLLELRDGDTVAWRLPGAPSPDECLVKPHDLPVAADSAIAFAFVANPELQLRLIEPFGTPELQLAAGYREAKSVSAKVSAKDGTTFNLDLATDLWSEMMGGTGGATAKIAERTKEAGILATSISIRISADGLTIKAPAHVIAWNSDESVDEETQFIAVEGVAEHQIVRQMMDVYHWYSDDRDADSYDSQQEYTESLFGDLVAPVTEGEVAAAISKAQEVFADALKTMRSSSTVEVSQITIKPLGAKAKAGHPARTHRLTITLGDGSRHTREI